MNNDSFGSKKHFKIICFVLIHKVVQSMHLAAISSASPVFT